MKSLLCLMALSTALLPLAGCETPGQTPAENSVQLGHAQLGNFQQIPDDTWRVLFIDRESWLSRYPIPNE